MRRSPSSGPPSFPSKAGGDTGSLWVVKVSSYVDTARGPGASAVATVILNARREGGTELPLQSTASALVTAPERSLSAELVCPEGGCPKQNYKPRQTGFVSVWPPCPVAVAAGKLAVREEVLARDPVTTA